MHLVTVGKKPPKDKESESGRVDICLHYLERRGKRFERLLTVIPDQKYAERLQKDTAILYRFTASERQEGCLWDPYPHVTKEYFRVV